MCRARPRKWEPGPSSKRVRSRQRHTSLNDSTSSSCWVSELTLIGSLSSAESSSICASRRASWAGVSRASRTSGLRNGGVLAFLSSTPIRPRARSRTSATAEISRSTGSRVNVSVTHGWLPFSEASSSASAQCTFSFTSSPKYDFMKLLLDVLAHLGTYKYIMCASRETAVRS
jgi:hypothetical protein